MLRRRDLETRHIRGASGVLGSETVFMRPNDPVPVAGRIGSFEVPQRIDVEEQNPFPFTVSRSTGCDTCEISITAPNFVVAAGMTATIARRNCHSNQLLIHLADVGFFMLNFRPGEQLSNRIHSSHDVLVKNLEVVGILPFHSVRVSWLIAVDPGNADPPNREPVESDIMDSPTSVT